MDLELRGNNVYRNGKLIEVAADEFILLRDKINIKATDNDEYHTVVKIDRLDLLAYKFYKDKVADSSKYWWVLADANNIQNPLDLEGLVGTDIRIPDILNILLLIGEQ